MRPDQSRLSAFSPGTASLAGGAALLGLFAAAAIVVRPRGEFPLNDDWNFALAAWHFAENLEFRFSRFTGMSLKLQVIWGAIWTWLFGRSFEVLRWSTLVLSAATLTLFWKWTGDLGWRGTVRWVIAGTLVAHPIFFWSSFTFMTQVPFLLLSMAALYATWRGYRDGSIGWALTAALLVLAASLIRQTGIAVAIPGLVLPFLDRSERGEKRLAAPFAGVCLLFAALYLTTDIFHGYPGQISVHYEAFEGSRGMFNALVLPFHHIGSNVQYGAVFALPLLVGLIMSPPPRDRRWTVAALFLSIPAVAVGAWQFGRGNPFPYGTGGSVLENIGLGPMTLRDVYIFRNPYPAHFDLPGGFILTLLAVIAGAILLTRAVRAWVEPPPLSRASSLALRLGLLHSSAATAILLPSAIYFDRYALDSLWSVLLWAPILIRWNRRARLIAGSAVIGLLLFATAATQEYFAWNRARWEAFHWLAARGVTLAEMDGGYEINQYLLGGWDGPDRLAKQGFSVVDDRYLITFNADLEGYQAVHSVPYRGLIAGNESIHVLERREP